jgi:hypothetical protein
MQTVTAVADEVEVDVEVDVETVPAGVVGNSRHKCVV